MKNYLQLLKHWIIVLELDGVIARGKVVKARELMLVISWVGLMITLSWVPENILLNLRMELRLSCQLMLMLRTCTRNVTQMVIVMSCLTPLLTGGRMIQP